MGPPPPALVEDLVEEVLLRLPPSDPALLLRAGLVCKQWRRLVSDVGFCRRFREFHQSPPMLGFFCNMASNGYGDDHDDYTRFFPTATSSPPLLGNRRRLGHILDSRHGRVLFHTHPPLPETKLAIWDPISDETYPLPAPPQHDTLFTAAVLCAAAAAPGGVCNHISCYHGPFLVVFVGTHGEQIIASVYSSETSAWSRPASSPRDLDEHSHLMPGALMANVLYFSSDVNDRILKFDLVSRELSGGRRLGLATVGEFCRLLVWSREDGPGKDEGPWAQTRAIDLKAVREPFTSHGLEVVGFADSVGIVFVATDVALFSVDLGSGEVKKLAEVCHVISVVPFVSFYTPALGVGSTGEGPSVGVSSA
ncbi:unnamed protein product [Urochloa decumbens]|uniref:F-box domain-containing protein n=1 Tax=Urochloa decumbens TaxID=240449 RepID=A0ABC9G9R8_9POAL